MALLLRKRLGQKTARSDLKAVLNDSSASSSESSLRSTTTAGPKDPAQDQQSVALDDLSTTPPPNRKLRSSKDFSRDKTPPQWLLEKYKNKATKQAVPTVAAAKVRKDSGATTRSSGEQAKSERTPCEGGAQGGKDHSPSITPAERAAGLHPTKETKKTGETRKVHGVEFDMLNQSKTNADIIRHGPSQGEHTTGHRRTRSAARREERERANSMDDNLFDDLKMLQLDSGLEPPPPLSIRKVDRTPSPRREKETPAREQERDGLEESARRSEKEQTAPLARDAHGLAPVELSTLPSHHKRTSTIDQAVSNIIPPLPVPRLPQPSADNKISPSSSPSSDASTRTPPQTKKSILKKTFSPDAGNLSITIAPPAVLPTSPPGYVFCSSQQSCSRPVEPWTWCKRWTCCSCAENEGGARGDGFERPAATMVEQKICSRLSCGHVRCPGCWMQPESRFTGAGPFGR